MSEKKTNQAVEIAVATEGAVVESVELKTILEETRAAAEAILQEAREEVARMKAVAAETIESGAAARANSFTAPAISEERVSIRLFKDKGKYSGDVFVGVNGIGYQIKRGIAVEVPQSVADVLEQSLCQDEATAMFIDNETGKYADNPLSIS